MALTSKVSFVIRCALPLVGLVLADCYVNGQGGGAYARPITVQAGASSGTVYAQPQSSGAVYASPQGSGAVYASPQGVVGSGWVTNNYAENDWVSYNMTLRARQFAAGYQPITELYRANMSQGQHEFVTVTAAPGRCYRIIGVGGPGVQDLDLRLHDMNGTVIDQDVATDAYPVLGLQRPLCLNWQGTFQVEIIMYAGGGQIGVQAFAQ